MRTIRSTGNKSARTYTLRLSDENGNVYSKYRTLQMNKDEFRSAYYWTNNDWEQFLKTDEYYRVK